MTTPRNDDPMATQCESRLQTESKAMSEADRGASMEVTMEAGLDCRQSLVDVQICSRAGRKLPAGRPQLQLPQCPHDKLCCLSSSPVIRYNYFMYMYEA